MSVFPGIQLLQNRLKSPSTKDRFNAPAEMEKIETVEKAFRLRFSACYKAFLELCNGGMITEYEASYYIDMTDDEPDGPRYSSFNFFPLEEVYDLYEGLALDDWMMEEDYTCQYPFIPIGRSPQQALIFMLNGSDSLPESPVLMSREQHGTSACVQLAHNFDAYLSSYLQHEGFPPLPEPASIFACQDKLAASGLLEVNDRQMPREEQLVMYSALIRLFPEDAWYYCMRGLAYHNLHQREAALKDFNTAISTSDVPKSFFYHCRGDLLLDFGSKRKALIDLDKAVQLEPYDPLYITSRANALYQLKKYEQALADCDEVLRLNPDYVNALMIRINIYRALGEDRKAEADEWRLEEIWDGQ